MRVCDILNWKKIITIIANTTIKVPIIAGICMIHIRMIG